MTRDYYGEARALGADLWEAGYKQWADKIDSVVEGGSTATEILMGLRWTLSQLLASEPGLPSDLSMRADLVKREIDSALA
jgi:hypothetical protein